MADWQNYQAPIRAAGGTIAAISVDDPERAEPMRRGLDIDYTILCDPDRKVVRAFGLLNMAEMGGVAFPAVFVIDKEGIVRWRLVETTVRRVHPRDVLLVLRALSSGATPDADKAKTRGVFPGTMFMRAGLNAMSRGLSTRWKK